MIVYKNNYEENEKLFSTGDTELDDILEEVYYSGIEDGYDYAQKEFAAFGGVSENMKDYRTNAGKGRAFLGGGITGLAARKAGVKEAERLSRRGANDREVEEGAGKKAARTAAGITAGSAVGGAGLVAGGLAVMKKKRPEQFSKLAKQFKSLPKAGKIGAIGGLVAGTAASVGLQAHNAKKSATTAVRDSQLEKYRASNK